ncbi:MAG: hypothetical protein QNK04_30615 [Myxococcota bacterium]|nr:hypothetical protein [Myxococcota bacterium]
MRTRQPAIAWVAALALLLAAPAASAEDDTARRASAEEQARTRATMAEIVAALTAALPLSLSDARFSDPAHRAEILAALGALAEAGGRLEGHAGGRDASFDFLSGSLARDSREILRRYQEDRFAEARFLLHQVTDNCVACHSRLPDTKAHPLGEVLLRNAELAALPPEERVELEVATRQFARALDTYESLFTSPDVAPVDLDLLGVFDDYLELCLRVQQDPGRPAAALAQVAARSDLSPPLRSTLESWIVALRELAAAPRPEPSLAAARSLLEQARNQARFPDDRRALVPYVAASGLLHRYVVEASPSASELAEAYYWLGVIESHVGRSFLLSQTESFLEASIRTAPGEPTAEKAFALLEEFVISGYTGSSGTRIPGDVQERLEALRVLIDEAAPEVPAAAGA